MNKYLFVAGILFAVGITLAPVPLRAQRLPSDSLKNGTSSELFLRELTVTDSRAPVRRSRAARQVDVIDRITLDRASGGDFTDALKNNSSLDVVQYPGLLSGAGIRGFRPQTGGLNQRTLLLVDGSPAGATNLATLSTGMLERVEVLKGPASALYGSQAMGGVVNLITRHSSGPPAGQVSSQYGSFNTSRLTLNAGGSLPLRGLDFDVAMLFYDRNSNYKLGQNNWFRKLLKADHAEETFLDGSKKIVEDGRADGIRRSFTRLQYLSGSTRVGYQWNKMARVDLKLERYQADHVESPSDIIQLEGTPSTKSLGRYRADLTLTEKKGNHELRATGYLSSERSNNNSLTDPSTTKPTDPYLSFKSIYRWKGLQLKDLISLGDQHITLGADYGKAYALSKSFNVTGSEKAPFNPDYTLLSRALYAQGQVSLVHQRLLVYPGLRYEWTTFEVLPTPLLTSYTPGTKTNPFISPSLGINYRIKQSFFLTGSLGRGFVTPDAYNVAGFSETVNRKKVSRTVGNPFLKNENCWQYEAGVKGEPVPGLTCVGNFFFTQIKDRISLSTSSVEGTTFNSAGDTLKTISTYVNALKAFNRGVEAQLNYNQKVSSLAALFISSSALSMLKAKELVSSNGSVSYRDVYNVAHFTLRYGIGFKQMLKQDSYYEFSLHGRYTGRRKDTDFNDVARPEVVYPVFNTVDAEGSVTFARRHTLLIQVYNLSDENYYEKRGYNLPGRSFQLRYIFAFGSVPIK